MSMATTSKLGKVLLYRPSEAQRLNALEHGEVNGLSIETAQAAEFDEKFATCQALLLPDFGDDIREFVRRVRRTQAGKSLPMLVVIPDAAISGSCLKAANALQVQLLPESTPQARRWAMVREACQPQGRGRRKIVNRRAHFRLPLQVKATLMYQVDTHDISLGGIAFISDHRFHAADKGRIDIRSLLGDMEEDERDFKFEVTSVKRISSKPQRFMVGAKFIELTAASLQRLKDALELIEPTVDE